MKGGQWEEEERRTPISGQVGSGGGSPGGFQEIFVTHMNFESEFTCMSLPWPLPKPCQCRRWKSMLATQNVMACANNKSMCTAESTTGDRSSSKDVKKTTRTMDDGWRTADHGRRATTRTAAATTTIPVTSQYAQHILGRIIDS